MLKGKLIKVEPVSTEHQAAETEKKTVEIRGLQTEDETEMCTYYFENPAKGGGDIEDSHWEEEEKIFYITFTDPKGICAVSILTCLSVFVGSFFTLKKKYIHYCKSNQKSLQR